MIDRKMQGLANLAGLVRDRELAKVEAIMNAMNRLRADIAQIEGQREARLSDTTLDLARVSGAELAWMKASEERLRMMQSQLAALRAGHEAALAAARKAYGRADVARRLAEGER